MIKSKQLSFMAACDVGENLITIDEWGRGIFQINKSDMSVHFLAMLKNMHHQRNIYQCAERFNNEIFFFPNSFVNEEVIIYCLDNRQIEYLNLEKISSLVQGDYKPVQRIDDSMWMFPTDFTRDAIIFHPDTREIETIVAWKQFMQGIKVDYTDTFAKIGNLIKVKNVLYYPIKGTNYIVGIDKSNYKIESHMMPADVKLHVRMEYDGQRLWVFEQHNKSIVAWNPETDDLRRYPTTFISDELGSDNWIWKILCGKKYLWILPNWDNRLVKMEYETGYYEFVDIFPQELNYYPGKYGCIFYTTIKNENIVDIYPYTGNLVIHVDLENDILLERHEEISLPAEWSDEDILGYQLQKGSEYESIRIDSEVYMDFFLQNIHNVNERTQGYSNGKNIWNQVSGE